MPDSGWLRDRLVLLLLACAPFLPALRGGFVYDDVPLVQEDPRVRDGDLAGAWTQPYWGARHGGLYRPVTTSSFVLSARLTSEPWLYRLTNLGLHAAATLLVLAHGIRLLGARRPAFLAAALFALHPIHVEVAANIVGRAESLAFLLAAGGWWLALDAQHRVRARALPAAIVCTTLGVLAKESALALALAAPLEVLLLAPRPRTRALALSLVPALAAAGVGLALRLCVLGGTLTPTASGVHRMINPLTQASLSVRLANVPVLLGFYLENLVAPLWLSPDYGGRVPLLTRALSWTGLAWALASVLALGLAVRLGGRRGAFSAGLFVLALAPVLQLVPIGILAGDRLAYSASLGFALLLGLALEGAFARVGRRSGTLVLATAAILAGLGLVSARDSALWGDSLALFERARRRSPASFQIDLVLGGLHVRRGEDAAAVEPLQAALELDPEDGNVWLLLGQVQRRLGQREAARASLEQALARGARDEISGRVQLGLTYLELERPQDAARELERAMLLSPGDGDVLLLLGQVESRLGRRDQARAHIERGLSLGVREEAKGRVQLGLLLVQGGAHAQAIREFRRAVELEPGVAAWSLALGQALRASGDVAGARAAFERGLALDPANPEAEGLSRWLAAHP